LKRYIFSIGILGITVLSFFTEMYTVLAVSMTLLLLLLLLDKMGKGIVLREIIAFLYSLSCLAMPVVGYAFYTNGDPLARLWVKYMPIPEETYFSYALPAIGLFCLAITLPFTQARDNEQGEGIKKLIVKVKAQLPDLRTPSLFMVISGPIVSFVIPYLPVSLQYLGTLWYFSSFAGLLYLYFGPSFSKKKLILIGFVAFTLLTAINGGMFTIVAYMGICIASFMLLGNSAKLFKKLLLFLFAGAFFVVLQNVKLDYRKQIWDNPNFGGNKLSLFSDLFLEDLQKGDALFGKDAFFPVYTRANQGFVVAIVMQKIPASKPFDGGVNLGRSFASAFVPRFLWPDKPEAGGAFNMEYYTGYILVGFSMNVGPLGEAYGSFGSAGGIAYMFILGLFIRWVYSRVFKIANKLPLLVCWIPVMFYQVISSAETDSLSIFNSMTKSALFVWLLFKIAPHWFGSRGKPRFPVARSRPQTVA
jgi:hypothetical protein